jgi:ABC-type nitrate/sulfonate/bicarbonate transport system ATPase subunit
LCKQAGPRQLILKNIGFAHKEKRIFKNFNLTIDEQEFVCILGKSGCGKSTLLKIIQGIVTPDDGDIIYNELSPITVFQKSPLFPWMTIYQNLEICISKKEEAEKIIQYYLKISKLSNDSHLYPGQLSGGMQQRVNIIRSFCTGNKLLLMDEPFISIDALQRKELSLFLLDLWEKEQKTILFTTHNINEAIHMASKILVLIEKKDAIEYEEVNIDKSKVIKDLVYKNNLIKKIEGLLV